MAATPEPVELLARQVLRTGQARDALAALLQALRGERRDHQPGSRAAEGAAGAPGGAEASQHAPGGDGMDIDADMEEVYHELMADEQLPPAQRRAAALKD